MELVITLLVVSHILTVIILGILCGYFHDKWKSVEKENQILKQVKEDLTGVRRGDRGMYYNYPLQWIKTKEQFKVTYEVEILDISNDKYKVNSLSFTTDDKEANNPINFNGIMNHLKDEWVSKSKIDIIIDDSKKRNSVIDEILGSKENN
jgi:hypothetical protein